MKDLLAERQAELTKQNAPDDGQYVDLCVSYAMGWQKPLGINSLTYLTWWGHRNS